MRRRYGYYWTELIGATLALTGWVAGFVSQTTLWESYGLVVRYLNTVGLRGRDPFLCPLVATRRAL